MPSSTPSDYDAISGRQQTTWAAGDFARIGSIVILPAELLCEAVDIRPGERLLDVAAGNGAASVAAARRWADVTALDFVDHLLDSARRLAEVQNLPLRTLVGDAQRLPFADGSFDAVLSTFGAVFRVTATHVPPPAGLRPAAEWGTEERLRELFGDRIGDLRVEIRRHTFRFRSTEHMLEYYRAWYGPTRVAFASLDEPGRRRLAADLLAVYQDHKRATDGTLVADSDYAEVIATVR